MTRFASSVCLPLGLFAALCAGPLAQAAELPADPCTLLSPADIAKAMGKPYGAPQSSAAPRPYMNTNAGTDCNYTPKGSGDSLLFRIYADNSPAQATDLFAKLKMFYSPPTPVPGIGDEAYFDPNHAIHVRKGKVRYFLQLSDRPNSEKPLKEMASLVAGKL